VTQIVAWGSMFYAFSVLIAPIEAELGWSRDIVVGAFSVAMLCTGLGAFPAGLLVDRIGGRVVMTCGSVAGALLLWLLGHADSIPMFYLVWAALGFTMSAVLYEPAFAVLTAVFGSDARKAITLLTLAGGLASTVFWPLTQVLVNTVGWRETLSVLALLNLGCAPLHAFFLPRHRQRDPVARTGAVRQDAVPMGDIVRTRTFIMLAVAFTMNMLAFSALTVHLIPLLHEKGWTSSEAVWLAALIGPMQVAGRVGEYTIGTRFRLTQTAMLALVLLPVGIVFLCFTGMGAGPTLCFVFLYGVSNGITTIARGAIPAELFGRERYGAINGALSAPVLGSRALGPFIGSIVWSAYGGYDAVLLTLIGFGAASVIGFYLAIRPQ
jgi:MFS family permease